MKQTNQLLMNIVIVATVVTVMVGLQACTDPVQVGNNFLEKPPSVDVTKDSIFSNADRAERFLWHAYRSLPYGPGAVRGPYDTDKLGRDLLASLTDINQSTLTSAGAAAIYYQTKTVPYSSRLTKYNYNNSGAWVGIRQAHIFLANVSRVPDMQVATKARLKAEARMIIALHYTDLFRNFGGVPWVDHAYGPNEDFNLPRLTARATLDSTIAMINRAIPDLPFTLDNPATESGRFTQAGAMGLKVRLLLFGASPLFNDSQPYIQGEAPDKKLVWYGGYDPSLWQEAADAAKILIDKAEQTGAYHLADTGQPRSDFKHAYYDRDSPEVLISTRKRYRTTSENSFNSILRGGGATTDNYVRMFPMANGKPITDATSGYDPQNPYENRDPRLYETVLVNGDNYRGRTAELWIGGRERPSKGTRATETGYRMRKFLTVGGHIGDHFPYLRLPEIHLSYAEALNEINGGPTQEAYEYVNKVRNRVDLGNLPTGLSQEAFREAVLRERVLEFGYEEVRWYDMVRWKRKDIFTKTLYGMNITKNQDGSFAYEQYKLLRRPWQDNWSPKWYLSAFPRSEVLKGLVQNPR